MNIYLSHSSNYDFVNELYLPIKKSNLNIKHKFFFPHDQVVINTKQIIKDSDLVLAEVSLPATGQGIELGWADTFNKRIICIAKQGNKVSGSIKFITKEILLYTDIVDLLNKLENIL